MTLLIIISSLSLLTTLFGIFYIGKQIQNNNKDFRDNFSKLITEINSLQKTSLELEDSLSKINKDISSIKENSKDMNAHDKMTDVILTKIKGDLSKIMVPKKK